MFPQISKVEYKILCIVALIMIVLSAAPYIVGYLNTPAGKVFMGYGLHNSGDQSVYYTYIEQIKNGFWANYDFYSPEKQSVGVFQISWLIPGLVAKIFNLSSIAAFHVWRIFLIPILVLILYLFVSLFFTDKLSRFIAFFLAFFGTGWGAYSQIFSHPEFSNYLRYLPIDLWVTESSVFLSALVTPHLILSLIFLLLTFYFWILFISPTPSLPLKEGEGWGGGKMIYAVFSGLSALVLFNFHPYFCPLVYLIIFVSFLFFIFFKIPLRTSPFFKGGIRGILKKGEVRRGISGLIVFLILSLLAVIYHLYLLNTDFVLRMRALESQASNFMPSFFAVLAGYGLFGILAVFGAVKNFNNSPSSPLTLRGERGGLKPEWAVLYSWFLANICLFLVPWVFPRRLTEGFEIPLALFSAAVFARIIKQNNLLAGWRIRFAVIILAILTLAPTSAFNLIRSHTFYFFGEKSTGRVVEPRFTTRQGVFYKDENLIEAMAWLKTNSPPDSVVLSESANGNILPVFSLRRVFVGHADETIFFGSRQKEAEWFFKTNNQDELKKQFLKREGINYIFWSENEQSLGEFGPGEKDYLDLVYRNEGVKIYKVTGQ